jgi:hypothetical protein
MYVVVYFKNCGCLKYITNTPTCFGSRRIHHQGIIKEYLTKITYNCSTVQVMRCQCLASYLTFTVCTSILQVTSRDHRHIYENDDVPHLSRQAAVLPYTRTLRSPSCFYIPIKMSLFWAHGSQPTTGRVTLAVRAPIHFPLPHTKRGSLSGVGAMVAP